jgi:hypothetical protein
MAANKIMSAIEELSIFVMKIISWPASQYIWRLLKPSVIISESWLYLWRNEGDKWRKSHRNESVVSGESLKWRQ